MLMIYLAMLETPGDKKSFEDLYENHYRPMLYIAMKILHNQVRAEDAVHEAFIKIIENYDIYKKLACNKRVAYCVTIVKRKAIDILREDKYYDKSKAEEEICSSSSIKADKKKRVSDREPLELLLNKEAAALLRTVLDELSEENRLIMELRFFQEISSLETARLLNTDENTINVKVFRIKKRIRDAMIREGFEYEP